MSKKTVYEARYSDSRIGWFVWIGVISWSILILGGAFLCVALTVSF